MTHAHPCLTKNWLNTLLFFAKYEGAVLAKCDCVVVLYGAARAAGSSKAKSEPTTRTPGYSERSIVSRDVGRKGDLRVAIFVALDGVLVLFAADVFGVEGVEGGEIF